MQTISCFNLKNEGAFICCPGCYYIDGNGNDGNTGWGGNLSVGRNGTFNLAQHGVPNDPSSPGNDNRSIVNLTIQVLAGHDRSGAPKFYFDPNSNNCANYEITGTTQLSTVKFLGVTAMTSEAASV